MSEAMKLPNTKKLSKMKISKVKNGQLFQLQKGSTVYRMVENGYFAECHDMHNDKPVEFKMYQEKGGRSRERTVTIVTAW